MTVQPPLEIDAGKGGTVRSWAFDAEPGTVLQAQKTARLPVISGPLALMPDAHVGKGATIGSVIPTEAAIIPAAVGVDLGCGMTAIRTEHTASQLPDDLKVALDAISAAAPAGFSAHSEATNGAREWLKANQLPAKKATPNKAKQKMGVQLGTLGGGNHFVEVSLDETDRVWVVLHSGSRGVGNVLASIHIKKAQHTCEKAGRELEDKDLAYFVEGDEGFAPYVGDMLWAQDYAKANRRLMAEAVLTALRVATGMAFDEIDRVDCHHNYAEMETHGGKNLWITRKGAIRAQIGDRGVIPGSMGDNTFIVSGKGCAESYCSSAHGSGRLMSRGQAKREISVDELVAGMAGRTWQADKADKLLDEAPGAYRDIATVIEAQQDLVSVEHKLTAVLNYKGCNCCRYLVISWLLYEFA